MLIISLIISKKFLTFNRSIKNKKLNRKTYKKFSKRKITKPKKIKINSFLLKYQLNKTKSSNKKIKKKLKLKNN